MIEWVVRGWGVFQLVGGILVLKTLADGRLIDTMMAALAGGARPIDRIRSLLLTVGGVLTAIGGAAAAALDVAVVPLMVANAVVQGGWLVFAAFAFPPEDDADRRGRMQTTRAFVVHVVATALVIWAISSGRIVPMRSIEVEVALGLAALGLAVWQIRGLLTGGFAAMGISGADAPEPETEPSEPPPRPTRVRLEPSLGCWPLWDQDSGRNISPDTLDLPYELLAEIDAFESEVLEVVDPDHDDGPCIPDAAARARCEEEAIALTRALEAVFGEDNVVWRLPGDDVI